MKLRFHPQTSYSGTKNREKINLKNTVKVKITNNSTIFVVIHQLLIEYISLILSEQKILNEFHFLL